jgi:hypothetical protein
MKIHSKILLTFAAASALGVVLPRQAYAQVNQEDFNTLRKMVQDLGQKVQKLEQSHNQDQQTHQSDQQQIDQLRRQLGETQATATDARQKAEAASQVQPTRPIPGEGNALHNFSMVGDAEIQFGKTDGQHSGFVFADFAPIFLFRAHDNVLFEAGFDIKLQNGAAPYLNRRDLNLGVVNPQSGDSGTTTTFDMSFAQLDYLVNDYVTFVGGDMLLPLGTYSERTAGWLNKVPDDPLPRGVLPGSGVGAQLRGAIPVGQAGQMFTYAAYGVNGPSSVDGTANSTYLDPGTNALSNLDLVGNIGLRSDGATEANLHGAPSGGGRLGWFYPWKPHYDLELGISGQSGTWDSADSRRWSAGVIDAALHIGPSVEIKGEYVHSWVETADLGTITPRGWWAQAGYKLAGLNLELPYINNLELVGRYDTMHDGFATDIDRYTVGYVYYFSNTLLFEGDYEFLHSNDPSQAHNRLVFQLSYGF